MGGPRCLDRTRRFSHADTMTGREQPQAATSSLDDYGNVGGNTYDKYGTTNPIARRMMDGFFGAFDALVTRAAPSSAFEVGCGEGHLSVRLLRRGIATSGFDLESEVVEEANANAASAGFGRPFTARSLYTLGPGELKADVLVCCEVLEHLPDPERALDILAAQHARHLILSVPREPLWRVLNMARGKYLTDLGNTPGHIQHWSAGAFERLVGSRLEVVEVRQPLPWTMLLCRPRGARAT
jgi:2-polyprenyl-3-methyl-5-hydroxy-6-metoxy-1,4-benzoquinol methylase